MKKKTALYSLCAFACILLVGIGFYALSSNEKLEDDDLQYVTRLFGSDEIPVVSTNSVIMRPYSNTNIKILQKFYDYGESEENQENSIINYDQTYIQSTGVSYGGIDETFDVIASLPGTVTSITEDKLQGKIVEVKYSDKITVIYESLSEVNVAEEQTINQSDIIGKSGTSNINKDFDNHLTFKIKIDGNYVDPEEYYDTNASQI